MSTKNASSTAVETATNVTEQTAPAKPVLADNASLLDTCVAALTIIGQPAHHTVIQQVALAEYGVSKDVCTPAWSDSRKADQSKADGRVLFIGKSVYGLKGRDEGKDGGDYAPDRRKGGAAKVMTPEQIKAEVARLQALLTTTEAK